MHDFHSHANKTLHIHHHRSIGVGREIPASSQQWEIGLDCEFSISPTYVASIEKLTKQIMLKLNRLWKGIVHFSACSYDQAQVAYKFQSTEYAVIIDKSLADYLHLHDMLTGDDLSPYSKSPINATLAGQKK